MNFSVLPSPDQTGYLITTCVPYGTGRLRRLWAFVVFALKDWDALMARPQKRYF